MRTPYGRMFMCHMMADSTEELLAAADAIGLDRKWLQCAGTYKEHFDLSIAYRTKAIAAGAKELTRREMGALLHRRHLAELKAVVNGRR